MNQPITHGPHWPFVSKATTTTLEQAQAETELGRVANEYMSRGEMLPSEVVLSLMKKRLAQRDCVQNGWILDGEFFFVIFDVHYGILISSTIPGCVCISRSFRVIWYRVYDI